MGSLSLVVSTSLILVVRIHGPYSAKTGDMAGKCLAD